MIADAIVSTEAQLKELSDDRYGDIADAIVVEGSAVSRPAKKKIRPRKKAKTRSS